MASLGKELKETIHNLEKIRDSQNPPAEEVLQQLESLYAQMIDLIDAAINKNNQEYQKAATAMQEAASSTRQAVEDLSKLEQSIAKVANAIDKVAGLLAKVA